MMRVYAKKESDRALIIKDEVVHDYGIEMAHNGVAYTISEDNDGRLILRAIDRTQIILRPSAANTVEISSE